MEDDHNKALNEFFTEGGIDYRTILGCENWWEFTLPKMIIEGTFRDHLAIKKVLKKPGLLNITKSLNLTTSMIRRCKTIYHAKLVIKFYDMLLANKLSVRDVFIITMALTAPLPPIKKCARAFFNEGPILDQKTVPILTTKKHRKKLGLDTSPKNEKQKTCEKNQINDAKPEVLVSDITKPASPDELVNSTDVFFLGMESQPYSKEKSDVTQNFDTAQINVSSNIDVSFMDTTEPFLAQSQADNIDVFPSGTQNQFNEDELGKEDDARRIWYTKDMSVPIENEPSGINLTEYYPCMPNSLSEITEESLFSPFVITDQEQCDYDHFVENLLKSSY